MLSNVFRICIFIEQQIIVSRNLGIEVDLEARHFRLRSSFFCYRTVSAVASNRPTEALASVTSFTFVVYSHYKHS